MAKSLKTGKSLTKPAKTSTNIQNSAKAASGMSIMSQLIDRLGLAKRLGLAFDGHRDYYKVFGYKKVLRIEDFVGKYQRQDIAKRIVDAPPKATWSKPPVITIEGDLKEAAFLTAWQALTQEFNVWSNFFKADKLAGLGNFSVMLMGFDDNSDLSKPLSKKANLLYLASYGQMLVQITQLDNDTTSPRFGMPVQYKITPRKEVPGALPSGPVMPTNVPQLTVHWTRILHVAEDALDNGIVGTPRLEAVYNRLDDLEKVVGGTGEVYWLNANRGMQVDIDKDMDLGEEDEAALSDEIDEYQHQLRRVIRTRGVKINNLGADASDPMNPFKVILSMISAATSIPQMVLMGAEQGHLASDQDRANWADRIKERRATFIEPYMIMPFIQTMINCGLLPKVDLAKLEFDWTNTYQLTPLEEAQTYAQKARAAQNLSKQFDNMPIMLKSEARQIIGLSKELPAGITEFTPAQDETAQSNTGDPTAVGADAVPTGSNSNDNAGG